MALPLNIDDVLLGRSVEWERLEFKKNWNPEDVLHTLCAFANDFHNLGGGYLFIGIADENGKPVLPPSGLESSILAGLESSILAGLESSILDRLQREVLEIGSALADQADLMTFDDLCRRMAITDGPTEHTQPRNVGLMFFHEEPERFFPQTQIDIVLLPDGPAGSRIIERIFKGPLSQMLRDALLFISNSVVEETIEKHPDRAEADRFFNYPYAAIEEILVNAVYHRSYEIREPIEVRVLPECITITSYPGPDRSISLADLENGRLVARRYRNRRIGEFLKELHLTAGRGTGVPTVIRAMRENGSPTPTFDTDADRTYFTATLPVHPSTTPQVTPQVTPTVAQFGGRNKMRTLLVYCASPRDRVSIQARLNLKDLSNLRKRYIVPAIAAGLLTMTDPTHPNSPIQKYRTTPEGLALLSRNGPEDSREDDGLVLPL